MQKTTDSAVLLSEKMALDTTDLMQVLSCGRETAVKIGEAAGAKINIGNRRVLWNAKKISIYLDAITTEQG